MKLTLDWRAPLLVATVLFGSVSEVGAQNIGTFRWQLAPFCNTLTLAVEQRGSVYLLTGYDDRCGASVRSSASGTAHLNPNGTIGMGLAIVRPDGFSTETTVTISAATFSGTWADAYGGAGTFVFNPAAPAGPQRTFTLRGTYAIDFVGGANVDALSAISFGHLLATAPLAPNANFLVAAAMPTASCPGTASNPEAAPGQLCVYERTAANIRTRCIVPSAQSYSCGSASRMGAAVYVESLAALRTYSIGSWAVTLP